MRLSPPRSDSYDKATETRPSIRITIRRPALPRGFHLSQRAQRGRMRRARARKQVAVMAPGTTMPSGLSAIELFWSPRGSACARVRVRYNENCLTQVAMVVVVVVDEEEDRFRCYQGPRHPWLLFRSDRATGLKPTTPARPLFSFPLLSFSLSFRRECVSWRSILLINREVRDY